MSTDKMSTDIMSTDKMPNRQNVDNFFFFFFQFREEKKFASFFCSYVVSELARFARGRIEDSSFNRFTLNGIPELPATLFFGIEKFKEKKNEKKKKNCRNFVCRHFVCSCSTFCLSTLCLHTMKCNFFTILVKLWT